MGGILAYGGIAVVCAFACGFLAASSALTANPLKAAPYVEGPDVRTGRRASLVRNGISVAQGPARLLLRSRPITALAREGASALGERGFVTAPLQLMSVLFAALVATSAIAGVLTGSIVAAVAVPGCLAVLLAMGARASREARTEAVRESVPEVLRSIDVCLQSGFTLLQTFDQVSKEAKGPLGEAFSQAAHLLKAGRPAAEALASLRDATSVPELSFVAVALQVQHEAGGSMRQVLEAAREAVEGEIELKRSLRVHTAQAKLSARIVSAMPLILVALFSLVSEGFLEPFFESPAGMALLALAVAMQVAGVVAVRRTLSMEISL